MLVSSTLAHINIALARLVPANTALNYDRACAAFAAWRGLSTPAKTRLQNLPRTINPIIVLAYIATLLLGAPQLGASARDEFAQAEWLGHVIVGA
jgi:hypothetical protein